MQKEPFEPAFIEKTKAGIKAKFNLSDDELKYYFLEGKLINNAYQSEIDKINILYKDGTVKDIVDAADTLNIKVLSRPVEKYYLCFPKLDV